MIVRLWSSMLNNIFNCGFGVLVSQLSTASISTVDLDGVCVNRSMVRMSVV